MGTLTSDLSSIAFYTAKFEDTFAQARTEIMNLTTSFTRLFNERRGESSQNQWQFDLEIVAQNNIKDPIKAKTKRERNITLKQQNWKKIQIRTSIGKVVGSAMNWDTIGQLALMRELNLNNQQWLRITLHLHSL